MKINNLIRPTIKKLKPYKPSLTLDQLSKELGLDVKKIIKLDTGENPTVVPLLPKIDFKNFDISRYPDPECKDLKKLLSKYVGLPTNYLICGNGSDELIDLLIRVFVNRGDEIIICPPTFAMYEFYGQLAEAKLKKVERNTKLKVDVSKILETIFKKTKIIFIDSPGNPAGTVIDKSEVEKLCKSNCIVVIDEAYFEYSNQTVVSLIKKYANLVVLRTFSKWAGLAGLRLGYLIANPEIIQILNSVKSPYNVNSIAQEIGTKLMKNPQPILNKINKLIIIRKKLIKQLKSLDYLKVYYSQGAYILFKPKNNQLEELNQYLRKNGIILKKLDQPILGNCLRANLGTEEEINFLVKVLKNWKREKLDSIIFDMDGVLINVSQSYRKTIELTTNRVIGQKVINQSDINVIKQIPGFNNDWDVSMALVKLINQQIPRLKWQIEAPKFLPFDRQSEVYQNVFRIFQTYYLGSDFYQKCYQKKSPFNYKNGLITKEKSLIDSKLLKKLKKLNIKMAIATGRPKLEAFETIKLAKLSEFFNSSNVVTLEDSPNEKPKPDPLLLAQKKIKALESIYIGDTISDQQAAEAAKMDFCRIYKDKRVKKTNNVNLFLIDFCQLMLQSNHAN
ncbi:MAG: histidinol-phosphate transaminase [Patescibacteria group bacterium]